MGAQVGQGGAADGVGGERGVGGVGGVGGERDDGRWGSGRTVVVTAAAVIAVAALFTLVDWEYWDII